MHETSLCRICGGSLSPLLDLGAIYPSNFVEDDFEGRKVPLVLTACERCGLTQLGHTLDMDSMYRQYWYRSGLNPTMVAALQDVVDGVCKRIDLKYGDVVVDIGCNDGTMLGMYPPQIKRVGFDPARNLAPLAKKNCDVFVNDYFSALDYNSAVYPILSQPPYSAKVITCIAMFYDLHDPIRFLNDVECVLSRDGIFVIQLGDLVSMMRQNAFDNICHEHLIYYSLHDLVDLLSSCGFMTFDVEWNDVNGGSVRVYAAKGSDRSIDPSVEISLTRENRYFENDSPWAFASRIERIREELLSFLRGAKNRGFRIHVLGASTKGNTLLQTFGIDHNLIEAAAEINPEKYGKRTVGTNIPIIPEIDSMESQPDYHLVLPWHFIDGFVKQKVDYLNRGGRFVVPLPTPQVIMKQFGRVYRIDVPTFLETFGEVTCMMSQSKVRVL